MSRRFVRRSAENCHGGSVEVVADVASPNRQKDADPVRAALHFGLLVTAELPRADRSRPRTQDETEATVRTGVAVFLSGYG